MAAGLGFKTFNTGEVLTAADVNGYLMQGVLVFADATARDAAITSPQEGQFAYTKDNNSLWYYTGSAWAASGATGDIEGVTAGTGISGGGTSGTVTITNSMATAIDAKGDLIVGTGADTFDRLAVGTNGHTLVADSSTATGLKWEAPAGGGKVLQVVSASYATETTTNSTTFQDTGLSVSITPSSASSKILAMAVVAGIRKFADVGGNGDVRLVRTSTAIQTINGIGYTETAIYNSVGEATLMHLDSPNTTSATTYKAQFRSRTNNVDFTVQLASSESRIVLMEIGA